MKQLWRKHEYKRQDDLYRIGTVRTAGYFAEGALIGCAVCWLCFNDARSFPLAAVAAVAFCYGKKRSFIRKQKQTLLYHFKDFITALHTALRAGYSIENGVISATKDMEALYGSSDILFCELAGILSRIKVRIPVEKLFYDLGKRSELQDITLFAELLEIGKKTGGNMNQLLSRISHILCDRIDTKQEIDSLLSSKIFEQKIMSLMPACIILYLRLTFPGFIEVLYGNVFGICMTGCCLVVYLGAFFWGKRIVNIKMY